MENACISQINLHLWIFTATVKNPNSTILQTLLFIHLWYLHWMQLTMEFHKQFWKGSNIILLGIIHAQVTIRQCLQIIFIYTWYILTLIIIGRMFSHCCHEHDYENALAKLEAHNPSSRLLAWNLVSYEPTNSNTRPSSNALSRGSKIWISRIGNILVSILTSGILNRKCWLVVVTILRENESIDK